MVAEQDAASAIAEHNLAAALGDLGRGAESAAAARRAIARGGQAPETRLVLARALLSQHLLDEAERALNEALALRPDYPDALRELAQLIWMRTGDPRLALAPFEALERRSPLSPRLAALRAGVIRDTSGPQAAYASLKPWFGAGDAGVALAASQAASRFDPASALVHALEAYRLAPAEPVVILSLAEAAIGGGDPALGLDLVERRLSAHPRDGYALALRSLARRALGAKAQVSDEIQAAVRTYEVAAPTRFADRGEWLASLAARLRSLHAFKAEPLAQSVRGGSQIVLHPGRFSDDPIIAETLEAFAVPVNQYLAEVMQSPGVAWALAGAWSVRLDAGGGHNDHVHPEGWVSSAFYVEVPESARGEDRRGWLRFGAAQVGPPGQFEPLHWERPEPGRLALFPSHLWHGVEPFPGPGERITIAFDVHRAS